MQPLKSSLFAYGGEFYEPSDEDTTGNIQYFGYLNVNGKWIIQEIDRTTSVAAIRYCNGNTGYSTAWTNRAILTYDYYNKMSNTVP
jgi:hypothetical protein